MTTAEISPVALAKHKSIASGQPWPPHQIFYSAEGIPISQESNSILQPPVSCQSSLFSHKQSALGCVTNKQCRRNQRQLNIEPKLAQVHSYHQQHSVPVDNRRYSHDNPVQVLKLQRPSSSSEPSLAGEVTGTDATTGSKVKFFLSSPLHPSNETTASPALEDEILSTIQEASCTCEPLLQNSLRTMNSDIGSYTMTSPPQDSGEDDTFHKNDVCKTHLECLTSAPTNKMLLADMTFDPRLFFYSYEQPSSIDSTSAPHSMVSNLPFMVDHCCQGHPSELRVHENPLMLSLYPTTGPILNQDKCDDSLTYSHETQILLPTSGPPIDPYNTRQYIPHASLQWLHYHSVLMMVDGTMMNTMNLAWRSQQEPFLREYHH